MAAREEIIEKIGLLNHMVGVARRIRRDEEAAADPNVARVVALLRLKDGIPTQEMATVLGIDGAAMGATLEAMGEAGLVEVRVADDGSKSVALTEKGREDAPAKAELSDVAPWATSAASRLRSPASWARTGRSARRLARPRSGTMAGLPTATPGEAAGGSAAGVTTAGAETATAVADTAVGEKTAGLPTAGATVGPATTAADTAAGETTGARTVAATVAVATTAVAGSVAATAVATTAAGAVAAAARTSARQRS